MVGIWRSDEIVGRVIIYNMLMWMEVWMRIGGPFLGTCSWSMEEPFHGALSIKKSFHCQLPRVSTLLLPTQPKRCFDFANLFSNFLVLLLMQHPFFSNNQSTIALTKEHQYHTCTKHIYVHFHFICWIIKDGKLQLIYCPTEDMVADILIKVLT